MEEIVPPTIAPLMLYHLPVSDACTCISLRLSIMVAPALRKFFSSFGKFWDLRSVMAHANNEGAMTVAAPHLKAVGFCFSRTGHKDSFRLRFVLACSYNSRYIVG